MTLSTKNVLEGLGLGLMVGLARGGTHADIPHRLRQDFSGFFRHKDMAGKPVVSGVLGDEPKVPVAGTAIGGETGLRPFQAHSQPMPRYNGSRPPAHTLTSVHPTYLLFFGWYPQKEMFFNWKK